MQALSRISMHLISCLITAGNTAYKPSKKQYKKQPENNNEEKSSFPKKAETNYKETQQTSGKPSAPDLHRPCYITFLLIDIDFLCKWIEAYQSPLLHLFLLPCIIACSTTSPGRRTGLYNKACSISIEGSSKLFFMP